MTLFLSFFDPTDFFNILSPWRLEGYGETFAATERNYKKTLEVAHWHFLEAFFKNLSKNLSISRNRAVNKLISHLRWAGADLSDEAGIWLSLCNLHPKWRGLASLKQSKYLSLNDQLSQLRNTNLITSVFGERKGVAMSPTVE